MSLIVRCSRKKKKTGDISTVRSIESRAKKRGSYERTFEKPQIGLTMEALHERRVALDLPAHLRRTRLVPLHLRPLLFLLEPPALAVGHARLFAQRGDLALERRHRVVRVDPVGQRVPRAGRVVRHRRRHGRVHVEERAAAPVVVAHAVVAVWPAQLHQASSARIVGHDGAFVVCIFRIAIFQELGEDVCEEHAYGDTEKSTCTTGGIICYNKVDKETSADAEANWEGEKGELHENII